MKALLQLLVLSPRTFLDCLPGTGFYWHGSSGVVGVGWGGGGGGGRKKKKRKTERRSLERRTVRTERKQRLALSSLCFLRVPFVHLWAVCVPQFILRVQRYTNGTRRIN